jgi:hypothetical protein
MLAGCVERAGRKVCALFIGLTLAGCVSLPVPPEAAAVQLSGVPAFAQEELQCGPAALASLLTASGAPATPESLTPDLFIPARQGSLQVELMAQARERGRVPLAIEPRESALIAALQEGSPVLMLLNLGVRSLPTWHYAVLTGYHPQHGYTLNAGQAEPEIYSRRQLWRRWDWAGRWGFTLHRPEAPPAHATAAQWIAASAPLERSHPALAAEAYVAATRRWPEAALPWAALGGLRAASGDRSGAVDALREAWRLAPSDAAIANNLASAELAKGCVRRAAAALQGIDAAAQPSAVAAALRGTRQEIADAGEDRCAD